MDMLIYLFAGIFIGALICWILRKLIFEKNNVPRAEYETIQNHLLQLENKQIFLNENINSLKSALQDSEKNTDQLLQEKNELTIIYTKAETSLELLKKEDEKLKQKSIEEQQTISDLKDYILKIKSENDVLKEKNSTIKKEIEDLGIKYTDQFKNLANEILEDKSKKFTSENQKNMKEILDPLNKEIKEFKQKVEDTYEKENRQRFSLEERIKDLVQLNQRISEEANNLTKALKGQRKTQGDWGEMILENILQQSGLTEGREYLKQEFLRDDSGNTLVNEEGKKMQPDFIILYPDKRTVIIDSKVSLSAYERYNSSEDEQLQKTELQNHLHAIYNHIDELNKRNYQHFATSLDFVIMFIPIEPAYLLAMQHDLELWSYAYKKRVLLISPTNLIAAVKMIAEVWRKEEQNKNALAIAERGAALYDKFAGFVENMQDIGTHLERSQKSYTDAMKQLKDGSGNLISQAEKLRKLGVQGKKQLPTQLLSDSLSDDE